MANAGGFILELDTLGPLFAGENILRETKDKAEDFVPEVEQYAKQNAPWEDRTGDARAGLTAEVTVEAEEVVLSLEHGAEYGLYLETIQSGRFAIIMPTLEVFAPRLFFEVGAIQTGEDLGP